MDPRLEQAYAAWLAGEDDGTFAELCEDPATFARLQRGLGDLEALGLAGGDECGVCCLDRCGACSGVGEHECGTTMRVHVVRGWRIEIKDR